MGDVLSAVALLTLLAIPLLLSLVALLDAARRPGWVWALAGRAQVAWIAAILFGTVAVPVGLVISTVYLLRVRPHLRATEGGQIDL